MIKKYILQTSMDAQQRLQVQHQAYEDASKKFLIQAGLTEGMKILEVGCGIGLMTQWLAQQVTDKGKLIAFDINSDYREITQERCNNYPNVTVLQQNVYDVNKLGSDYDLIYCRMVLHHLDEPELAIQKMIDSLKVGGVLVCEEPPTCEGAFIYPHSQAFNQYVEIIMNGFKKNDSKFEVAYTLESIMQNLNMNNIAYQVFQPLAKTKDHRLLHIAGLRELAPRLEQLKISSLKEIEALAKTLEIDLMNATSVSLWRMFQASGTK